MPDIRAQLPKLLIIDDDPQSLRYYELLLQDESLQILKASSGLEGINIAKRELPDLIILDVLMPGVDGYAVCRALRREPRTRDIPILVVTSLDDRASRINALEQGADEFISKPVDPLELKVRVRTLIRLNRVQKLTGQNLLVSLLADIGELGLVHLLPNGEFVECDGFAQFYLMIDLQQAAGLRPNFLSLLRKRFRLVPQWQWTNWPSEESKVAFLLGELPTGGVTFLLLWPIWSAADNQWIIVIRNGTPSLALNLLQLAERLGQAQIVGVDTSAVDGQGPQSSLQSLPSSSGLLQGQLLDSLKEGPEAFMGTLRFVGQEEPISGAGLASIIRAASSPRFGSSIALDCGSEGLNTLKVAFGQSVAQIWASCLCRWLYSVRGGSGEFRLRMCVSEDGLELRTNLPYGAVGTDELINSLILMIANRPYVDLNLRAAGAFMVLTWLEGGDVMLESRSPGVTELVIRLAPPQKR